MPMARCQKRPGNFNSNQQTSGRPGPPAEGYPLDIASRRAGHHPKLAANKWIHSIQGLLGRACPLGLANHECTIGERTDKPKVKIQIGNVRLSDGRGNKMRIKKIPRQHLDVRSERPSRLEEFAGKVENVQRGSQGVGVPRFCPTPPPRAQVP